MTGAPIFEITRSSLVVCHLRAGPIAIGNASDNSRCSARRAEGAAMAALDPADVDHAIQNGVRFLRQAQQPQGQWGAGTGPGSDKGWAIGYTCLAGLALVECGVPTTDAGLKTAAIRDPTLRRRTRQHLRSRACDPLPRPHGREERSEDDPNARNPVDRRADRDRRMGLQGAEAQRGRNCDSSRAIRRLSPPQPTPPPSVRERPPSMGICIKTSDDTFLRPPPPAFDPVKAANRPSTPFRRT